MPPGVSSAVSSGPCPPHVLKGRVEGLSGGCFFAVFARLSERVAGLTEGPHRLRLNLHHCGNGGDMRVFVFITGEAAACPLAVRRLEPRNFTLRNFRRGFIIYVAVGEVRFLCWKTKIGRG
jgi:hypothetical protein